MHHRMVSANVIQMHAKLAASSVENLLDLVMWKSNKDENVK